MKGAQHYYETHNTADILQSLICKAIAQYAHAVPDPDRRPFFSRNIFVNRRHPKELGQSL